MNAAQITPIPRAPALRTLADALDDRDLLAAPVFVVPELVERGAVTLLAGKPKLGKSTFVSQVAAAVTRGVRWDTGEPEGEPGRVLWLAVDEPLRRLVPRLASLDIDPDALVLWGRDDARVTPGSLAQALEAEMPALVVLDTLSQLASDAGVNPNDGQEVAAFLRPLVTVLQRSGAGALLIHHAPHHDDRAAGSYQWGAIVDATFAFRLPRSHRDAKPGEGDDDDDRPDDGRRILRGVTRWGGPMTLRLTFAEGRYTAGGAPTPLRDRVRQALYGSPASANALVRELRARRELVLDALHELERRGEVRFVAVNGNPKNPGSHYALTESGVMYARGTAT